MRSYGQFCPVARAVDVLGDRWTMLILRELLIRDSRYSDLRDALPGIATNLLAERLRQLEGDGLVQRVGLPRPASAVVYQLTERGREVEPVIHALARWGAPLLSGGQGEDTFRSHWLRLAAPLLLDGADLTDLEGLTVLVHGGDAPVLMVVEAGRLDVRPAPSPCTADVELTGAPSALVDFLRGGSDAGVTVAGSDQAVTAWRAALDRSRSLA
ncbi:winged helix-turn-helix transcriptional regulator [Micromonospora yasonensis]|uniref:winged helix-turn-helix transcriptional regulator n=1 Tax=Micromonospora yasonensis TaxID=1128667 RepID=UPI002230605E|nr:helix-turn-helix domain-containing protein [Micromonospora yasonensis]MCW3844601.1 winged helix-turn-helix transcriptional regulator [Micromonospora yasonensis]